MSLSNRGARRARRVLSGFTALVLVLAMVGPTMPVLAYAEEPAPAVTGAPAPEAVVEAPPAPAPEAPAASAPEAPAEAPPSGSELLNEEEVPAPSDRAPSSTEPPAPSEEIQPLTVAADAPPAPEAPAPAAAPVVAAAVTASGGAFTLSLEGYNLAMGKWTSGNLGKSYREGDNVQFRVILDNSGQTTDYVVPAFSLRYPFYRSQDNAIGCDMTGDYGTVVVDSVATGDARFPTTTPLAPNTLDGAYPVGAAQPSQFHASYYDAGRIVVPAGKITVLYWEAHLARTDVWNAKTPSREGSSFYPGSSSHFAVEMTGVGQKDVPWPQIQPLGAARIIVHKFNDLDGDGVRDDGEPPLSGWTFTLTGPHGVNLSKTTGSTGTVEFSAIDGVEPGNNHAYVLDEIGGHGPVWYQTTSLPITIPFGLDDGSDVEWVGNREKVTKTFRLTLYSVIKTATFRADYYEGGVKAGSVDLLAAGPSSWEGTAGVMAVTEFSSVKWYAVYGGEDLLLGTTGPETISADKLNCFTYENQVCGAKVNDLDGDGDPADTGEPYMSGWAINLYRGTELWDTTTTDAEGKYYFVNLIPGTYHVEEVLKSGWAQTLAPASFTIPRAGTDCPPLKFYNHLIPTGRITVNKFNDLNGDGNQDAGEGPLAGWTFTATGPFGYSQSKTTTESGSVTFDGLEPGSYQVTEAAQTGWVGTTASTVDLTLAAGGSASASFGNRKLVTKTFRLNFSGAPAGADMWVSFATASGTTTLALSPKTSGSWEATAGIFAVTEITGVDWMASVAGIDYLLGHTGAETISADKLNEFTYNNSIGGTKYNDLDGDGMADAGEPALAGWTIELFRVDDFQLFGVGASASPAVATAVTDPDGHYAFTNLLPGIYAVREVQQAGWTMTHEPGGTVLVADDTAVTGLDFLNRELVTKTFRLTFSGAPAGASMWVRYTTASGATTLALSPTTPGSFEATAGIYAVTEITGVDWMATVGGTDYLLGHTGAETISADALNEFTYNNSVAGVKFNDLNSNGARDAAEAGLSGWTINLYRLTRGGAGASAGVTPTVPAGYALVDSTTTGTDGSFSFSNLLPGTYLLAEVVKPAWVRTVGAGPAFAIEDGSAVAGLAFGNVEEFLRFTAPDLAIVKSVNPTTFQRGATPVLTYKLVYTNTGDAAATDFVIIDTFDATLVSVEDAAGGTVSGNTIKWTLAGPLAPGASGTITYKLRVKAGIPANTTRIDNRVVITMPGLTDSTPVDDESTARVTITEGFLPFTGGEAWVLMLASLLLGMMGVGLMRSARKN